MNAIELHEVAKRFGTTPVLEAVNLTVADGSITAVLGASGSGKTTLLRIIAGFEQTDRGSVSIDGRVVDDGRRSVRTQHRGVGFVPQDGALFPHLTVAGNIGFGLTRADRVRVGEMLELVGLVGLDRRYPHQLSGGQQQRVALARALAIKPRVVLLDEPFSSLDAELRVGVRRDVARALAETGATTVLVTHDQDEAMALADQIAVLKAGRMVAVAEPHELYRDPLDLVAATSIGEANVLAADIDGNLARCVLGGIPFVARGATPAVGSVRLLLRPEQLVLHVEARANTLRGSVIDAQYHGHDSLVDVVVDGAPAEHFLARAPGNIAFAHGQPVWIEIQGKARVWT